MNFSRTKAFGLKNELFRTAALLGVFGTVGLGATAAQAQTAAAAPVAPLGDTAPLALRSEAVPADVRTTPLPSSDWLRASISSSSLAGAEPLEAALPEAPTPQIVPLKPRAKGPAGEPVAPIRAKFIPAGWHAQPLGVRGKVLVGATDLVSIENLGAIILSAGYEHVLNSEPNYGVDKGAFGERLGAAAIRETSQGVFTDMVLSPLLHEDPRYYQEGASFGLVHRTLYAITRPLITRTDGGHSSVNGALLLGYAASAALTPAYYPSSNRNFHDVASVYGGSIGGAALGFFVSEFSSDVLAALHLSHNR